MTGTKKPTGINLAAAAANAVSVGYTYDEMDCQAFVEFCARQAGGQMDYRGSNDMARHAVYLATLENARAEGKLVPGAGLLIHEDDESGLPAAYRGDGLGDFSHVGLYIGDGFGLTDTDKNGKRRECDVVHSSASMARVAGSTLKNGWTHVMWFEEIDYGVNLGALIAQDYGAVYDGAGFETENAPAAGTYEVVCATVYAENGKPVKIRSKPSTNSDLYWTREVGTQVEVLERGDAWCKVRSRSRVGYMMTKFLVFG